MLPRRLYVQCPICDEPLEAVLQEFSMGICVDEEDERGLGMQLGAFVRHECEA